MERITLGQPMSPRTPPSPQRPPARPTQPDLKGYVLAQSTQHTSLLIPSYPSNIPGSRERTYGDGSCLA